LNEISQEEIDRVRDDLMQQIQPTTLENFANKVLGTVISSATGLPIGGTLAKQMQNMNVAQREALMESHIAAIEKGATPQYDAEGNYTGFDTSTMNTFADEFLASDDPSSFLPGGTMTQEEIDAFNTLIDAQEEAARNDPTGSSTETGFIAGDETFFVNEDGTVTVIDDDIVDFDRGGGDSVSDATGGGDDVFGEGGDQVVGGGGVAEEPEIEDEIDRLLRLASRGSAGGGAAGSAGMRGNVEGLNIRGPKQFAAGGLVTPNIDRFIGSLR
jgi:hypothetical protein